MSQNRTSTRSKLLAVVCCVQAAVAVAAAVGTFVEVESIIGFGPAMAVLGFVLALVSLRRMSVNLLLFGLSASFVTAVLAICIAVFEWNPNDVKIPSRVLLTLYAIVAVNWGTVTGTINMLFPSEPQPTNKSRFSFSILSLLGVITFMSLLFALLRQLVGKGEMAWFAVYGAFVLILSEAIFLWFLIRVLSKPQTGREYELLPSSNDHASSGTFDVPKTGG